MADALEVKPGDKVSWSWGSGQPGGTAAEVKQDTLTMETARGNEVKKDGQPGDPAVRIERSGHDVVKKANELEIEKPGPQHSASASGSSGKKEDEPEQTGLTHNSDGKDVSATGKPDSANKEADVAHKNEDKGEKKTETPASASAPDGHKKDEAKPAEKSAGTPANGDKKDEQKAAEQPAASSANGVKSNGKAGGPSNGNAEKSKPEKKAKAPPKPKAEKPKRKAATDSGEPRRSKRIRGGE